MCLKSDSGKALKMKLSNRFARAQHLPPGTGFVIVFWLAASSIACAACIVPPAMQASLKSNPTGEAYTSLGNWFADQKQFDCAANAFASAFRQQPKSASLAYLWGLSLYSAGRDLKAMTPLEHAEQLDSSDIRPHLVLGVLLEKLKKRAEAEAEWRAALAIDPDSAPALDGLSQALLNQKDYAAVVALLEKPFGGRTRSELQSLNLGIAYAGTARLDEAARVLREGLNTVPDSLPIADELSVVLMLLSRTEEAFAVLDRALEKHPDDQPTQLLYLRSLVSNHSDKAPQFARKLLANYPNHWEVLYLNGILESREGRYEPARLHLVRSVAANPTSFKAHNALGTVLAQLGDLPAAREHLEKAIALGDNQPEVEYDLAKVLQRLGEPAQARETLRVYQRLKNLQSAKTQAAGKAEVGDQAIAAGNAAQAASLYREALESDPDEPLLRYKLAKALDKLQDFAGEKTELQQAIKLNPDLAEAQNQMGYLAARSGTPADAEGYFRAAVHASPSFVVAWVNLAATLASEAKWKDAHQALDRALEIDPDNAEARKLSQALAEAHAGP